MKKTALRKEFWMSIRKSPGRFLSIFLIVALGVSFFSGIRASEPDMRVSGDRYYDETNLMDLKVQGSLGLTDDDVKALSEVEGIRSAEGGYSVDALCKVGENEEVIHIASSYDTVNQTTVSEGRMPKGDSECVLDEDFMEANGYEIGDTIELSSGTEDPLTDSLKKEDLTIVGAGSSPEYISIERGSSLIGNGEVSAFAVVAPEAFVLDVYTEIYLLVDGAEAETCYTDGYDDLIAEVKKRVEDIADVECVRRTEEIKAEALQEIADSQSELDDAKKEADEELAKAEQELQDAEQQITDGQKQIDDGKAALESGKAEISSQEKTLQNAEAQYQSGAAELQSGKTALASQKEALASGKSQAQAEFAKQEEEIANSQGQLDSAKQQIDAAEQELAAQEAELTSAREEMDQKKAELAAGLEALNQQEEEINSGLAQAEQEISQKQQELDALQAQIDELEATIASDPDSVTEEMKAKLSELKGQWESGNSVLANARTELETKKAQAQEALQEIETQRTDLTASQSELEQADQTLSEQEAVFQEQAAAAREELSTRKAQWEAGVKALEEGKAALASAKQETEARFASGDEQIAAAEAKIRASESELSSAASQIASGRSRIEAAKNTIMEQEASLTQAEAELADGRAELESGRKEYETQKADAEKELADAQIKIDDAKAEVDEIEDQEWYVNDRDVLAEYTSYGENADRMRAIGEVFPELFFLVAALISLTTMTRMVEEERTQIGTLKALGYGKGAIAGKYMMYAFLATMGGSIFGVLIGEKLFPYVILYSYQIMYTHLPHIVIPYQWSYAVMATGAALACTLLATFYACYKELAAQPAELMRPPSPKEGKRILLERISLIWKHLSFTWKSSIRNLFRYKKRFFMTIAGIGGCMALMVVGFGIRDSIMCIGTIQYQEIQVYDGMIYLSSSVTEDQIQQIQDAMDGMDKMDSYIEMEMTREPVSLSVDGSTEDIYLAVPEDKDKIEDFMNFRSRTTGEVYHIQDDGIILTEKMANTLDVSSGDTIYLGADGLEKEVTVTAVCENYMEHYVYMSPELYQELYGEEPDYNSILFDLKDASAQELSQTGEELLKYDGVMNVTYTNSIEDQLNTMLQSLNLVIVVLIVSAGLLAFVVLYNLNNINITERRRELATLKVLGFYDTEVSSYVYRENIMLTIFSIAVGIVLGALLHRFVITTVEVDAVMFGRVVKWQSYLYSALFTTAFSLFVNWVMYYKLKKIDMVESLKSVE
ncbi:FtsX-like permease family protein [Sellimonas catena]|uniref:ABC transporter permease n=1 Tax=Sellimonas catena TaxID=2994035 RepID=A0A9W6FGS2_9FIRM|nr:FtsX-like permease family protein [Sellimonas catena]GLG91251.1 ABC transporter permease [Sellimonas catena]